MNKPFKMRSAPFKRNFGIGESESPDAVTPNKKIDLKRALAAGMATLPGGHDAYQTKSTEYERDKDGNLVLDKDGKPISKTTSTGDTAKPLYIDKLFKGIGDKLGFNKIKVEDEDED
jgi:hypothetical protein